MQQVLNETKSTPTTRRGKQAILSFLFKHGTLLVIALTIIVFSLLNEKFLTYANFTDILRSISIITLLAIGVTISLIVGGFDLSVGSIASVATIASAAALVWYRQETIVAIIIPLLIGLLIGLFNSLLVVKIRIPDLLGTLAVMYIVNGIHLTFTKGYSIYNNMPMENGQIAPGQFLPSFLFIGQGEIFSVPFPVILMLTFVILTHILLNYTRFGRLLYITGGNEEAARLSGVPVQRYKTYAYILSALFATLAGIVLAARIGTGQVSAGAPLLMDGVAASFIGYSVFGAGKPNVIGTFFGAVLIGILLNGLTMLNVPYYAQDIIKGSILICALAFMYVQKRNR
ncbi:ABC transporter permease [Thermoflavimicrobium dichotomicum]|uniref:Simple sugar transport system permease protein n=1 Tax=Thermoflavimicrobium dichotomicum TaxID=46223 RepID=A0A1I3LHA5_9BACL|nr:ABC transporter permease [Thermoflavimicrobium dichotomicum]SFI83836.1 simple sugar transport system permease protein [Thermoflavimicrobium dichotomicum]